MSKRFIKQLLKLFIPYTIIILFIFSLSSYAYYSAFKKIEHNELEMQKQYIEQSKLVLDRHFEEVTHIIYQLSNTPIFKAFSVHDEFDLDNNYSPMIQLRTNIENFQVVNSWIYRYYIFYKNSEVVVSTNGLFTYRFFDNYRFLYGHNDKEVFWDSLFNQSYNLAIQHPENLKNDHYQVIPIKSSIGYQLNQSNAVIYMQLSSEKIRENMIGYAQDFDGNFLMVDEDGKVLVSLNTLYGIREGAYVDIHQLEDELLVITAESEVIPYTYVLIQSSDKVFEEINEFRRNGSLFFFAILLGGLLVSVVLARYNTKPLVTLMDNNELLSKRVANQLPYLRMNFLEKWLNGNYVTIDEIMAITKFLKTNYIGNHYSVAVIDYQEHIDIFDDEGTTQLTETEAKKLIINDLLTDKVLNPAFIHSLDHNKLAVIFVSDCLLPGELEMIIRDTLLGCDEVLTKAQMNNVHYGIGNIYKDMTGIPTALTEAIDSVVYAQTDKLQKFCWFKDIEIIQDICYYPPEIESRLYNCIRSGDHDQLVEVLRDLFHKNIVDKNLNQQMQQIFIYEMYGTLVKLQQRTFGDDTVVNEIISSALRDMKEMSDIQQIQYCKQIFVEICDIYGTKQGDRHVVLMERIDNFIKDNFHDPDFGLPVIADEFNVSYTYLSEIIKDFKDMSFINYLQHLRMNKAKELLEKTDMQVKEIFTQCGYNSSNSFGKAFKRIHGVTASVYRDKYRSDHSL